MHEQSETRSLDPLFNEGPTPAINVYGRYTGANAGRPLPPIFRFERDKYPNLHEAIQAAVYRSGLTDAEGTADSNSDVLRSNPQIQNPNLLANIRERFFREWLQNNIGGPNFNFTTD